MFKNFFPKKVAFVFLIILFMNSHLFPEIDPTNDLCTWQPTAPGPAPAATHYASPGDNLESIIGQLSPGDVLNLAGGTYYGQLTLSNVNGTASSPIVIQSEPGERAMIVNAIQDFSDAPNNDWELVDGSISLYRSVNTYGGEAQGGWLLDYELLMPNYSADGQAMSWERFVSTDYDEDPSVVYVGPGVFHHSDGHIYVRLEQNPTDLDAPDGGTLPLTITDTDPRNTRIIVYLGSTFEISNSEHVVFRNIDFGPGNFTFELASGARHIEITGCNIRFQSQGILVRKGTSDLHVHHNFITMGWPEWNYWKDVKSDPGEDPLDDAGWNSFAVAGSWTDSYIHDNVLKDCFDGISVSNASSNTQVMHNYILHSHDDAIDIKANNDNCEIAYNVIRHCFEGVSLNGDDGSGTIGEVYVHHNIIDVGSGTTRGRRFFDQPDDEITRHARGIAFGGHDCGGGDCDLSESRFYNNTIVTAVPQVDQGTPQRSNQMFYNNIVYVIGAANELEEPTDNRGNVYWATEGNLPGFVNSEPEALVVDPGFDDTAMTGPYCQNSANIWEMYRPTNSAVFTSGATYPSHWPGIAGVDYRGAVSGEVTYVDLTVNVTGSGSVALNPSGGSYVEGTVVTLTANPDFCWAFDHWSGDLSGSANPETITMDSDKSVTAVFVQVPTYTLTVNTSGSGSVSLDPSGGTYSEGTVVTLTANPDAGWQFDNWSGDLSGTNNPETITMDTDKSVTATFSELPPGFLQSSGADGIVSMEAENYDGNVSQGGHDWTLQTSPSGYSGSGLMQATPDDATTNNTGYESNSPRLDFKVNFVKTGTHYVWIRGNTTDSDANSVHAGLNGSGSSSSDRITYNSSGNWEWSDDTMDGAPATIEVSSTGLHTLNIWMREAGVVFDKVVLTTNASYTPSGTGPAESPRGSGPTQYSLTVNVSGSGSVSLDPSSGSYDEGTVVTLTANPASGWQFDSWSGDLSGSNNPETITMDADKSVTANFSEIPVTQYTLTVNTSGSGSVSLDPSGGTYDEGTVVTLTANPASGWQFDSWSGDLSGSTNPESFNMDANKSVTAIFSELPPQAAFQQDAGANGIVSMEAENYDDNVSQAGHDWTLQTSPSGYSGNGLMQATPNNGTTNNTGYESNSPRLDFKVNFVKTGTHYVWIRGNASDSDDNSVHAGLDGSGFSTSDRIEYSASGNWEWTKDTRDDVPATIEVSSTGVHTLNIWMREDGVVVDKVVLTTSPGYTPSGTGPAESPRTPGTQYTLTVNTSGNGSVTLNPSGGTYNEGTVVTLTANPDSGWQFDNWSGDLSGSTNPETITMDANKSVTATFTQLPTYTLTVNTSGSGSVSLNPSGGTYSEGTVVTLTANPASGWQFNSWSGDLSGSTNPETITMVANKGVTATFSELPPQEAFQQDAGADGIVSMEAENYDDNVSQDGHDWTLQTSPSAYSGSGLMKATPDDGTTNNTGYESNSPRLDFKVNFVKTGTHYVWIRGNTNDGDDNSVHAGLDGSGSSSSDRITYDNSGNWEWSDETMDGAPATIDVSSTGLHTLNIWMREDGVIVDKVVLTTSPSYTPSGTGPAESPRTPGTQYTLTVNTSGNGSVTLNPSSGTYNEGTVVTLTANPASGWHFDSWSGDLSGSTNPETITMDANKTVTAAFIESTGEMAFQQDSGSDGIVSIEAENYDANVSQGGHDWTLQTSPSGYSGNGLMQATPNDGTNINTGYESDSPRLDFKVNFVKTGTHYVWIRGNTTDTGSNSLHAGLDGSGFSSSDRISYMNSGNWEWTYETLDSGSPATIDVTSTGVHTLNIWMREDGVVVDKVVLTTSSSYTPSGTGPAESPRGLSKQVAEDENDFGKEAVVVIPQEYSLSSYPNPFNPSTNISYTLPKTERVTLIIYDLLGRKVATLIDGIHNAGEYTVQWNAVRDNGDQVANGVYLVRIQTLSFTKTIKLAFIK